MFAAHNKKLSWFILLLPLAFFGWVSSQDHVSEDMPLPTSLSYLYDVDGRQGWFYSFDRNNNEWNAKFFDQEVQKEELNHFIDSHKQAAKKLQTAVNPVALEAAQMELVVDKLNNNPNKKNIIYHGHERTDLVQIYSETDIKIKQMSINGRYLINGETVDIRAGSRLIEYHLDGQKELNIHITLADGDIFDWQVISHQFNLMNNRKFDIKPRPKNQIPKPFVLTDNTAISQRFTIERLKPQKIQQTTDD